MFEAGESLILSSIFFLYLLRYIAIFLVYDTVGIGGVLGGDDTCIWHGVFFFFFWIIWNTRSNVTYALLYMYM